MTLRAHQERSIIGRELAEMEFGRPEVVHAALRSAILSDALGYLTDTHTRRLQEAVAQWLLDRYRWHVAPRSIRPVADLVGGFRAVLEHFVPDKAPIIVPTPAYMPFLSIPPGLGHPVIEVPMRRADGGWSFDWDGLRRAFESGARTLVLCNPHNPIGKVLDDSEMREIEALVDEFDGLVFADEIHAPLTLGPAKHRVYAARSARAARHTITATSATKAFNIPGTKCGQLVFTSEVLLERWMQVGHWDEHQTSPLGVVATEAAYLGGVDWLEEVLCRIEASVAAGLEEVQMSGEQNGIRCVAPEATYLLWMDLKQTRLVSPQGRLGDTVLREAGLVVTDGESCGAAGKGCVRFNAALPAPVVREAMHRLAIATSDERGRRNG